MTKWHDVFSYCPSTGRLIWKIKPSKNKEIGDVVGVTPNSLGYRRLRLNKKLHYQHRVIYEMFIGEIPEGMEVDHIDGNPSNNLLCNLRLVSHNENMYNRKVHLRNKFCHTGVSFDKSRNKYVAYINHSGKRIFLGRFNTSDEAICARERKEKQIYGEFSRLTIGE